MTLTIAVSRDTYDLPPLVITGSKATALDEGNPGLWIPARGYVRPKFNTRRTFAPDSAYVHDKQPLAVVLDEGTMPLTIGLRAADAAALATLRAVLSLTLGQWRYAVTVTLDGVAETWTCRAAWPTWPESAHWQRLGHEDRAVVTLPVEVP